MPAADVVRVLDALDAVGVAAVIDGGWAVDALVGRLRRHDDLDLIVPEANIGDVRAALRPLGLRDFARPFRGRADIGDGGRRRVGLHLLDGSSVQHGPNGERWFHPPSMLAGAGSIEGRSVRCVTPERQLHLHLDHEPDHGDRSDLDALRAATAIGLPLPFAGGDEIAYRDATASDAMALAEVQLRSARRAYASIFPAHLPPPDRLLLWRSWCDRLAAPRTWTGVVTVGRAAGGVVHVRPWPDGDSRNGLGERPGEICAFYVHPDLWGRHLGETLFTQALARADAEYDDVRLWVLVENTRARRYYERRGWERDGACQEAAPGVAEERWRRSAPHQSL